MESELTFVAPEGVYSVTEEHKPSVLGIHTVNATPTLHPTRLTTVVIKFPPPKPGSGQVFTQLLGGNREKDVKKDKPPAKEREDGLSVSSSDTPDDPPGSPEIGGVTSPPEALNSPVVGQEQVNTIFSQTPAGSGKKKPSASRPKHNMRKLPPHSSLGCKMPTT